MTLALGPLRPGVPPEVAVRRHDGAPLGRLEGGAASAVAASLEKGLPVEAVVAEAIHHPHQRQTRTLRLKISRVVPDGTPRARPWRGLEAAG